MNGQQSELDSKRKLIGAKRYAEKHYVDLSGRFVVIKRKTKKAKNELPAQNADANQPPAAS